MSFFSYLAFWMSKQRADNAQSWESMDAATRQKLKDGMTANGAKLMISAFGATEFPTTGGVDPAGAAQSLAQWVKDYGMDGVDVVRAMTSHRGIQERSSC